MARFRLDDEEPRRQLRAGRIEVRRATPERHEHVLDALLRQRRVTRQPERERVDDPAVTVVESAQSDRVPARHAGDGSSIERGLVVAVSLVHRAGSSHTQSSRAHGFPFSAGEDRVSPVVRRTLGSLAATMVAAALVVGAADPGLSAPGPAGERGRGEVAIFYYPWYGTEAGRRLAHWYVAPRHAAGPSRQATSRAAACTRRRTRRSCPGPDAGDRRGRRRHDRSSRGGASDSPENDRLAARRADRERPRAPGRHPRRALRRPDAGRRLEDIARLAAKAGITDFYIYDSILTPDADWRALARACRGCGCSATRPAGQAMAAGFDGLYTYDVYIHDGSSFPRVCALGTKARSRVRAVGRPGL